MASKNRGTYALLVLFFAALVGLWAADFARLPTRKQQERMSTRILFELIDTKPDDLRKIEILGGDEPIVFERGQKNPWQMTSPMDVAADPSKVETLAYNLKELSRKSEADTLPDDPERYGLAPPSRIIRLWGKKTEAPLTILELGKVNQERRYVRHQGSEGVEVVDARGLDLVRLAAIDWRDRELFRIASMEIDSIRLSTTSPQGDRKELELRHGRDAWRITSPVQTLAFEPKVEGLIADLATLKVFDDTRFVANNVADPALERYGLKPPLLAIEVGSSRSGRPRDPQVLHVGKPVEGKTGQVYARRGDQDDVVAIDTRVLKELKVDPNLYRSPKVADLNLARVAKIEVEEPGGGFEVVRLAANDWAILKPSPSRADTPAIQKFLGQLDQLQTSNYQTLQVVPDPGFDATSMVLKIWQTADTRDRDRSRRSAASPDLSLALNLRVGRLDRARKSLYAQVEGDPTILVLPEAASEFLPRNSLAFRDRQVLSGSTEPIERIKLNSEKRNFTLSAPPLAFDPFGNGPMGWWMVEPVNTPADANAIGRLLKLLANLRAESLVADKATDLSIYGLNTPLMTMTWSNLPRFSLLRPTSVAERDPSKATVALEDHTLMIGSAVTNRPNVRYAKIADRPLIFTVGPEVLGIIDAEWRDHHILTFNPRRVRKLRLDWPDRGLTLESRPEERSRSWSLTASTEPLGFDTSPVETLVRLTSNLTTSRFTQYLGEIPDDRGLTPARVAIRYELEDGSQSRTLRLGNPAGRGMIFATTETQSHGAVFLVPEALFAPWLKLPRRPDDLPDNVFAL